MFRCCRRSAYELYLRLEAGTEPVVLNHAANMANHSRPELVPDDRGRILPMFTDRYISIACFEIMSNAVKVIVTWEYIVRLVRMLEGLDDKVKWPLIVQELSNTCHLEYRRAQAEFRRQMTTDRDARCFRRITTGDTSKIAIKGQPSDYTVSDPRLHYILRLCHPDTNHTNAAQWIQKLDDHNTRHTDDLQRLMEGQVLALGDLAIIVSFMHTLSTSLAMVPGSKKLGLLFTGRTAELDIELAQYKVEADFGDHLVPANTLLEPGVAANALGALDEFVVERAGTSLGSLYKDMLHDCLKDPEKKYRDTKRSLEKLRSSSRMFHCLQRSRSHPATVRSNDARKRRPAPMMRSGHTTSPPLHRSS